MHRTSTVLVAGGIAAALVLPLGPAVAGGRDSDRSHGHRHGGTTAVGLAGDTLVSFSTTKPSKPRVVGEVSGLSGDTRLVGIDHRVQDGKLYGVGDRGGVYTISGRAVATKVSQLTVALAGSTFGVDFNPAADRLRVISDTGQNLRHDVNPGGATIVDGTLTYPATPTAPAATGTGVTGAAYTNNDLDGATATTLFDIDTALDQVVTQVPANAGTLSATGKLGVDAGTDAGFDIDQENRGWAALSVGGAYGLYEVDLLTGEADRTGSFPRSLQVSDVSVPFRR
ncbi:DUF4394 domain-containing protein [Nocardioides aurantiacus]|uniref:Uncharacterized protein DUF4394 n=1 Tax=Nocardioides aurantiacus TaxID=86796 RepID=A0A3N2CXP8_9ACTN|nr:DUF4394 domain-containing protein [Nocardioides aurantiacus]ROR92233.1 uncharacterized protein DUF4394 [Nocardioides aurantiacus]